MNTILGRPIQGEIGHFSGALPKQANPQEFLDALDALLAIDEVAGVRWEQYTPYFNDGEACVFWANGPRVKLSFDDRDEDEIEDSDYGDEYHDAYSLSDIDVLAVGGIYQALRRFEGLLTNGSHYVIMSEKFGDPATVTATPAGFEVEFYEHD